jgi:hypothetical protein
VFDFTRILLLISFIFLRYSENDKGTLMVYFVLTIQSWMGLLENMRIFETY